ncbi:MAG: anthranilate synthase component I [Candidatus Omnitrophica bacterium]|nr:anthranilate synthase component I [Candidatus Omnitrophota bacterium]
MEIHPSLQEFTRSARRANVIPVWGELLADLETPVSAFLKLDDGRTSFLLESVAGEEKVARFSFLGSRPRLLVTSRGRRMELTERPGTSRSTVRRYDAPQDPLRELEQLMTRFHVAPAPELPRFYGGLVGYLGYDVVRFLERLPAHQRDPLQVPDLMMMLTESIVIFDHAQHKILLVVNAFTEGRQPAQAYRECRAGVRALAERLRAQRVPSRVEGRRAPRRGVRSNLSKAEFSRIVKQAKHHIRIGDIIQVVLSQRFERPFRCPPFDAYRALRSLNPSPYMYFLRFGPLCLAGASPEMLVRCEDGRIETRPIAGTRPRGRDDHDDERRIQQLLRSPKERAEHLMLVDLGRNDVGRVAQTGSVSTPELMVVEKYSHVMHLVSGVRARLRRGKTAFDVLRAAFPAGTVTGAPKVRAMELIAALEREARGPYAGAVGYVSFSGNLDTCITIRTILMQQGRASVQAGAGIVADSHPAREYQETVKKAQGCLEAVARADAGLDT